MEKKIHRYWRNLHEQAYTLVQTTHTNKKILTMQHRFNNGYYWEALVMIEGSNKLSNSKWTIEDKNSNH